MRLRTFAGATLGEENFRAHVEANSSRPIGRWEKGELGGSPDSYLSVRSTNGTFRSNRHFFAAIKDLPRKPVHPEVAIAAAGDHELRVQLQCMEYLYFVHPSVPDEATSFDDNYFDVEPAESRTIVVTNPRRSPSAQHVEGKLVLETRACLGLASLELRILEPGRRDGLFT